MDNSNTQADNLPSGKPALWRLFGALILPTLFILVVITLFITIRSALGHDPSSSTALVNEHISYFFILNLSFAFCIMLLFLRKDGLRLADIGFRLPDHGFMGFIIEISLAVICTLIVVGLITAITPLFETVQAENPGLATSDRRLGDTFWLSLFSAVIVASFVEESIFRGYGITGIARHWGLIGAILISSIFFGLYHVSYGIVGVVRTFFQGLVFALLFARSRSLLGPMVGHSLTNLISTLSTFDVI